VICPTCSYVNVNNSAHVRTPSLWDSTEQSHQPFVFCYTNLFKSRLHSNQSLQHPYLLSPSLAVDMATSHPFSKMFCYLLAFLLRLELGSAVLFDASFNDISNSTYDYVIAGCGISGLVLARRLSEDAEITVLCLEAGTL
jgi:GMC oxidoreductase